MCWQGWVQSSPHLRPTLSGPRAPGLSDSPSPVGRAPLPPLARRASRSKVTLACNLAPSSRNLSLSYRNLSLSVSFVRLSS